MGQTTQVDATKDGNRLIRLTLSYLSSGNNGNLSGQTIETGTRTFQQFYGYDGANLSTATCGSIQGSWPAGEWCVQYGYDGFGNAWSSREGVVNGLVANGASWYQLPGPVVTNRLKDVSYL